ncbi:hypothetical protein [Amycolatopsis nigrescens]|uniref:hypothetical protein n=1 Tax=Amycolatopsis nigrescens TaxID=381445 RepID=UPI000366D487|nr:hypothetical protein [Amycolatopsis nigrescens]
MDLTAYVDNLGRELAAAFEAGGDESRELFERLTGSLESAIRLTLLDALSGAMDEITRDLAPGSVELRLRGRDPRFVVTPPPPEQPASRPAASTAEAASRVDGHLGTEDGAMARINFRVPEQLKTAIEKAAAEQRRSVNAWLVRVASAALETQDRAARPAPQGRRGPESRIGWVH